MSEKELTPEEIVKRIEEKLEQAKKLPGGIGAYMFMAMAKEPEAGAGNGKESEEVFSAQITTYGRTNDLAHLYLGVPKKIKMAAGLIGVSKMLGNLTENDSTPNKE